MRKLRAIFVLAVLASVLGACSDDEDEAVFSFATDDLCSWVSEDEVAKFVAAEFDWDGEAVVVEVIREPEAPGCDWELSGNEAGTGNVAAMEVKWVDFDGNPIENDIPESEITDFEAGPVEIGASVVGHPSVTDGVVVTNGGFGQFAFSVPEKDAYLQVEVHLPREEWDEAYEARFFAVADHFLEALGWLPEQ